MKTALALWRELIGLFVDDGRLALMIVVVIAAAVASRFVLQASPNLIGALLAIGAAAVLADGVWRGRRRD